MAFFVILTSAVFSSNESLSTDRMGFQKTPAVSISQSGIAIFRPCFKVKAMQEAIAGAGGISVCGLMKSKTSLYELLEISSAATAEDVKRAYRKLARVFHPDHAASTDDKVLNTQKFLGIHNAYVTLSDPHYRAQYDRQLSAHGRTWSKVSSEGYGYSCGHMGRRWETDQCW